MTPRTVHMLNLIFPLGEGTACSGDPSVWGIDQEGGKTERMF